MDIKYATIGEEEFMKIDGVNVFRRVGCECIIEFRSDEESMAYVAKDIVETLIQCRKAELNNDQLEGEG